MVGPGVSRHRDAVTPTYLRFSDTCFTDLAAYRAYIDEIVARKNRRNAARIDDAERATLQLLLPVRTGDYKEFIVLVTIALGVAMILRNRQQVLTLVSVFSRNTISVGMATYLLDRRS